MKKPPRLCRHRGRNYAFVYLDRKQVYLGPWGSDEAQAAYDRLLITWAQNNGKTERPHNTDETLLSELFLAYIEEYKARPVRSISDTYSFVQISKRLIKLFPEYTASEFRVRDLEIFRNSFQQSGFKRGSKKKEYSRTYLNKLVNRVKAVFAWGVYKELVPPETAERLKYLPPLHKGHTNAPEAPGRHKIPDEDFQAVREALPRFYRDIVDLLRLTGMRPSELTSMMVGDIDRKEKIWVYRPAHHKTESHGNIRAIPFGEQAQKILLPHIQGRRQCEYVFTPARAMESKWAERRKNRKSKITPSQKKRDEKTATKKNRRFKKKITPNYISRAVARACKVAMESKKLKRPWTPYELRHTAITEVREKFGAEAAQHFAGHSNLDTQKYYDHSAENTAIAIASQIG